MKKATIILIAAIYVASIVVVGVFGLQALLYSEVNPITDFDLPDEIAGKQVKDTTDGKGKTVIIAYEEGLEVPIEYVPVPADSPSQVEIEITYQSGTEENPTAELSYDEVFGKKVNYFVKFFKKGKVTITFRSLDNSKFSKTLNITAR